MGRANLPHPLSSLAPLLLPSSCAQAEASALLLWGDAPSPCRAGAYWSSAETDGVVGSHSCLNFHPGS